MFKKFITSMVINAIEKEFGFLCAIETKNIQFYKEHCDGTTNIYFSFETIFEDCTVYGWINTNGDVDWNTYHDAYHTTKEFYSKRTA